MSPTPDSDGGQPDHDDLARSLELLALLALFVATAALVWYDLALPAAITGVAFGMRVGAILDRWDLREGI